MGVLRPLQVSPPDSSKVVKEGTRREKPGGPSYTRILQRSPLRGTRESPVPLDPSQSLSHRSPGPPSCHLSNPTSTVSLYLESGPRQ